MPTRSFLLAILAACGQNGSAFFQGSSVGHMAFRMRGDVLFATKAKKKTAKKTGEKQAKTGFGGSIKAAAVPPKELLARSEKKFEEIEETFARELAVNDDSDLRLRHYVISARLKGEEARRSAEGSATQVSDWVPLTQLIFMDKSGIEVDKPFLTTAVSTYAREAQAALTNYIPSLKGFAAPQFEYAVEPLSSFENHVYPLFDPDFREAGQARMGKKEALSVLFETPAEDEVNGDTIKRSYRKLSMKYHPDRVGDGDDAEVFSAEFRRVQDAYMVLGAESHSAGMSWYESIGGTDRTDFSGALELSGVGKVAPGAEKGHTSPGGWSQAVIALDSDIPKFFASRNAHASAE